MLVKIHSKDNDIAFSNVISVLVQNKNDTVQILPRHQNMVYLARDGANIEVISNSKRNFIVDKSAIISIMNNEIEISII
jgi:hypothetical protein